MELDDERPDSFNVSLKLSCAVCHAGAQPKSTPQTIDAARLKKSTGRFKRKSASDGRVKGGIMATITLSKPQARLMPKRPPIRDKATLPLETDRRAATALRRAQRGPLFLFDARCRGRAKDWPRSRRRSK